MCLFPRVISARKCEPQPRTYLPTGLSIEPKWYMPIIPFVLINGSDGIGTGWSSSVPSYNPRDIIANIR